MSMPQRAFACFNSIILILYICNPFRGGLGEVNVVSSMIIGEITGSSFADAAAFGSTLIHDMTKQGYSKELSTDITGDDVDETHRGSSKRGHNGFCCPLKR